MATLEAAQEYFELLPGASRLPEGGRPPYRRGSIGQHVLQRRRPDRANPAAGDRYAAAFERSRRRAAGRRRWRGVRGLARRRARQRTVLRVVGGVEARTR